MECESTARSSCENCTTVCCTCCRARGRSQSVYLDHRSTFCSDQCCSWFCGCLICLPCCDLICDRCYRYDFCYNCLHCNCFYGNSDNKLPNCDTTPGLVRQSSTKSIGYVSPCAGSSINIIKLTDIMASNDNDENLTNNEILSFTNPAFKFTEDVAKSRNKKTNVVTQQPPRLSLKISTSYPVKVKDRKSKDLDKETSRRIDEEDDNVNDFEEEVEIRKGDTGEEEINTAEIKPEMILTNIFVKDFKQTTV